MSSAVFHRDLHAEYESVVSASGMYLQTEAGQQILDAVGGAGAVVLGHGVQEITDSIARHGKELSFVYGATFTNPWQEHGRGGDHIQLSPPYVITRAEIDLVAEVLDATIAEIEATL